MNVLVLILYYLVLLLFVNNKFKICLTIITIIIFLNNHKYILDNNYHLEFLDIGQGDSVLIRSPRHNEIIMIDTGGSLSFQVEEWKKRKEYRLSDNVLTYLKSLGITKIDYLILTHGDADHLGEATYIINDIKVENVILNDGKLNYAENKIIDTGVKIAKEYQGDLNLARLKTEVVDDENSNSQIYLLTINNFKVLLMGDATKAKELEILKKYKLETIDLIKLGHHGSRTSSDEYFLETINVKEAIISSGRNNKFGHPHTEVVETLDNLGIKYFNTQTSGTISYKINNNKLKIETCPP